MELPQFFAAPFAQDGQLKGVGASRVSDLSPDWLGLCEKMLQQHGPSFRASFGNALGHIEVCLNSESRVGIGMFCAKGRLVASTAYLRGQDAAVEQDVVRMMIESLRKAQERRRMKTGPLPFEDMARIKERPLHVVVAWGDPLVPGEDQAVVGELADHFAAAYLCR